MGRGSLRIYLGAAPGVGKTYAMLDEGWRRRQRGTDTVIAVVETHGRASTAAQIRDLETVPRRRLEYRGTVLEEMDVNAVLARRPAVALVDELAHTNAPGSRHEKRWQDVEEMLDAGIDVISTVNVQHLESLNDVVATITGITQHETVPDAFVRAADQIELVDMTPEALRRRMAHGNIYPAERINAALANYFRPGNLGALRELALLWVADRVQDTLDQYLVDHGIEGTWETREKVVVTVSGAPSSEMLIRRAARMATRSRGELVGVRVVPADGLASRADEQSVERHRTLLQELGGVYHEVVGDDVASALAQFARSERATQLVIGTTQVTRWKRVMRGSIVNRVIDRVDGVDVHVIATESTDQPGAHTRTRSRRARVSVSRERQLLAWTLLGLGGPLLVAVLVSRRDHVSLTTVAEVFLAFVVVVAAIGGLAPGLTAGIAASLAINWYFTPPFGTLTIADAENVTSLVVFLTVAVLVSFLVDRIARQAQAARRARTEAESIAWSTAELVAVDQPLPRLLEHLRATFGQEGAAVLAREADGWHPVEVAGLPVARPDDGERFTLPTDDRGHERVLVLAGRLLDVDERRVLGVLAGNLVVAMDAIQLAARAQEAERVAEADAVRTALLQAVSHDLRTPLAAIKAYVSGLRQPDVQWSAADLDDALAAVEAECDRLNRLVGNLLDASRLQAGSVAVARRPVAVDELVYDALTGTSAQDVEYVMDPNVPLVDTDPVLIERALANVVENAVRHSPSAAPVVVQVQQVGDEVHIRVADRGPGIPAAVRGRVFEPFQRAGDTETWPGVGLGLAIARGFTEAVGAELELDDTPGGGLTVTFRLPMVADAPDRVEVVP